MADVTISSLPIGTPSGNVVIPYSDGSTTYTARPSAIVAASSGSVLQVVYGTYATQQINNSQNSYVDTGLQATISPKTTTSRFLINVEIPAYSSTGSGQVYMDFQLVRNNVVIQDLGQYGVDGQHTTIFLPFIKSYVDTLGVFGTFTYKVQVKGYSGTNATCLNNKQAVMTIWEIAG